MTRERARAARQGPRHRVVGQADAEGRPAAGRAVAAAARPGAAGSTSVSGPGQKRSASRARRPAAPDQRLDLLERVDQQRDALLAGRALAAISSVEQRLGRGTTQMP